MVVDNQLSDSNPVKTRNFSLITDANFNALGPLEEMTPEFQTRHDVHIRGLEDLRLYKCQNFIKWIATSMEYSHNGKIRQIYGDYCLSDNRLRMGTSLKSPTNSDCEKNWIPYNNKFIYKWHPFQIGSINNNKLVIEYTQETPLFFSHMRGSSTLIDDGTYTWGITHCVIYEQPRKYYHMLIKIESSTNKLLAYTNPFFFINNSFHFPTSS
jgi:hypothetical protein